MKEDSELLRDYAQTRSEAAFAELVRRRVGLVYSVALRRLGDSHRAQDVAQMVFNDLARKAASVARRPVLAGWLYRSAYYAASDIARAERSRAAREQEAHAMHEITANDEPMPDWEKIRPMLDDVLQEMDERDRDAVLLRFFDARPFAEIGARLQLSENAARMRVDRALEKLRLRLGKRGIDSTSAALAAALASPAMIAAPAGLAATIAGVALSGAGVAGSVGGVALATAVFMKTPVIVSTVAALAFGTVFYQHGEVRQAEAEKTALVRERDAMRAQLLKVEDESAQTLARATAAEQQVAALKASPPVAVAAASGQPAGTPNRPGIASETPQQVRARQEAMFEALRQAGLPPLDVERAGYDSFYDQRGFTDEQRAQFKAILVAQYRRSLERDRMIQQMIDSGQTEEANARMEVVTVDTIEASMAAEVAKYFGEETAQALQRHRQTSLAHTYVKELAEPLFDTGSPLTPAQVRQWLDVFYATAPRNEAGRPKTDRDFVQSLAPAVLSPAQLVAVERFKRSKAASAEWQKVAAPYRSAPRPVPVNN